MTRIIRHDSSIDALLAKHLLNQTSRDEAEQAEGWINASPENAQYYEGLKQIYEAGEPIAEASPSEEEAWGRFKQRIGMDEPALHADTMQSDKIKSWGWLAGAAAAILIIGAVYWFMRPAGYTSNLTLSAEAKALTDTLPDQTIITLNKNSYIKYPKSLTGDQRSVELQGEAFFTVTNKEDEPFIVHVDEVTITDIGTEFNVKETADYTEVIVATGSVVVSARGESVLLKANEKVLVSKKDGLLEKEQIQNNLYNYYQTQQFVCENTPLSELTETLSAAYNAEIVIEGADLAQLPITTTFQSDQPLDSILNIISQTFDAVSFSKQGEKIILSRQ